ncbi:hypothetical protein [Fictibacillus gelatini]|uniref:hypothetical protein n=1 Tax=Fictibacillus gelatini TaxID=225985 RepID=UPI0003F6143E|nr:hypothetical protein [Fictibacillus gelatini]
MNRHPLAAFLLAFFPGVGHFYLNKKGRGALYSISFFGCLALVFFLFVIHADDGPILLMVFLVAAIWLVNMLDMIVTLLKGISISGSTDGQLSPTDPSERSQTMLFGFVPGLGHFHLGLMNRGLTFMIGFFGLIVMILFVAVISNEGGFLVFLGVLPIVWIYSFYDVVQQLNKKQRGEVLFDRTILEDFEEKREEGKKSKTIATLLAIFPGAGHMYLGLQRRGFQLMASFLLAIYILDVLHLLVFLFLIPLLWFFSFFDCLQKATKHGKEPLEDAPLIAYFSNHQKWIGIVLIVLGVFYLFDHVVMPVFGPKLQAFLHVNVQMFYDVYFQTTIVSFLIIAGGLKLLFGSKEKKEGREQ